MHHLCLQGRPSDCGDTFLGVGLVSGVTKHVADVDMCLTFSWWHVFRRAPDEAPGSPPAPGRQTEIEAPEQPGRPSEPAAHQAARYQGVQQRRRLAPHFERQVDAYHQLFDVYDVKQVYAAGQAGPSLSGCAASEASAMLQLHAATASCLGMT